MVKINKAEALALRTKYGDDIRISIVNAHKNSKRKHYYADETSRVISFLKRFRGQAEV